MITKADLREAEASLEDTIENVFDWLRNRLDDDTPDPPDDDGEAALKGAAINSKSNRRVSRWPITVDCRLMAVVPEYIWFKFESDWPDKIVYGGPVHANVWFMAYINGEWHAATLDWVRENTKKELGVPGEHPDTASALASHIKKGPLASYAPRQGDKCGLFVSSLARDGYTTVNERSNVILFDWPY